MPGALQGLPIVITHRKPGNESAIQQELRQANTLGVWLVFPELGRRLRF